MAQYEQTGEGFDEICCLLPTAPTITPDRLRQAHALLTGERFDCVFPAVRFSYPVQRALFRRDDGTTGMVDPSTYKVRSQDLEPRFHDAGQFYWVRIRPGWQEQPLLSGNVGSLVISELEAQDIDTEDDWAVCEFKFRALQRTS